jgi:hypothetical protein
MTFEQWYRENKESDLLHEHYQQCLADMREVEPSHKQTFKQWAREYYKSEIACECTGMGIVSEFFDR